MATEFDASDFVDSDFQAAQKPAQVIPPVGGATLPSGRPPTREELDTRVGETQRKLAELKRAQEELERARAALEEARRRQVEFQNGRNEIVQSLTRGTGLLAEAEFAARRDAEQMTKTLAGLLDALAKVQAINEETWTKETYNVELTRALTTIENARLEWNSARLKWPLLSNQSTTSTEPTPLSNTPGPLTIAGLGFFELCKLGLALTWPMAVVALVTAAVLLAAVLRH
jgi:hypothetical protein